MKREKPRRVVIAGGGLAGIAAALRLVEFGVEVTLLETRRKLGGRATSFTDPRSGEVLDNCQHVVLGCCTNYLDLLERLGVADVVQWHKEQYWLDENGGRTVLKPCGVLPAPLHYAASMLAGKLLTQRQMRSLARACLAILRTDRREHEDETFGDYLRRLGQGADLVARFWSPIVVSACNCDVDRVSAEAALHVFQEGFLANTRAGIMGVPGVPLVRLYDRAFEALERAGGRVMLGESVERIDGRRVVTGEGREHGADRVICALPFERVMKVIDPESDPRIAPLAGITHSPILGVHVTFDRPVLAYPHAVLVERPTQWLFRKIEDDTQEGHRRGRQTLHAVISAADAWIDLSEEEIGRRVIEDIHACVPEARGAGVVSVRSVKEKRATFAPLPGVSRLRPHAAPADDSGVILAGDYTATGWPATMEGATRSGYVAAAVALGLPERSLMVGDLKASALARALAG